MKINKLTGVLLACATMVGVSSCNSGSSDDGWKNIDAIAVQESKDGNWEFYKPDGTILYEDEFKSKPSAICNGFFVVQEGDGYTVYRADKKPEILGDLEDLKDVGYFSEDGLMPIVRPNERISIINTKGETVFTLEPYKDKEIICCEGNFTDGLLAVATEDDLWGFVDTKGNMVIEPKYKGVKKFKNGRCAVARSDKDDSIRYMFIDKKGEVIFTLGKGQELKKPYLSDNYSLIKDDKGHLLIIDKKGETVFKCPSKVKEVVDFRGDKFIFMNPDRECGLMDLKGETLIRPKYKFLQFVDGDKVLAQTDEGAIVLNYEGEVSLRFDDYESVGYYGKFGFRAHERSGYIFFDNEGKPVKNGEFENVYAEPYLSIYVIKSDYFSMDAVINKVVGLIQDNGVGKYNFNATPSQGFSDPKDYVGKSLGSITDLEVRGNKYLIDVQASFTSSIARYSNSYYSSSRYEWGDGELQFFIINIMTQEEWGIPGAEALLKAFESNGFKVVARTDEDNTNFRTLLRKDNELLYILSDEGYNGGLVYLFPYEEDTVNSIKNSLEEENRKNRIAQQNLKSGQAYLKDVKNKDSSVKTTASGLMYKIHEPGNTNIKINGNSLVTLNYVGKFVDGTIFDQSQAGNPVTFSPDGTIPGFAEGLKLLAPGAKATLYIPADLAYGMDAPEVIGPNQTVVFDVEIISVR